MKERTSGGAPRAGAEVRLLHTLTITGGDGVGVLDGCLCDGGATLCLSASDFTIRCYHTHTATSTRTITGHTCAIKDVVSSPNQPHMLYSSQEDTGVMVTDLRTQAPVCFLAEFCSSGAIGGTVGVSPNGQSLAVPVGGDVHIVDTRTWTSTHVVSNMHLDEITRLRFLDDAVYCSAGEDQMINFIDSSPTVKEDDMLLQAITCGEVITKMSAFPELGLLCLVGSCENAYICPFDLEINEVRHPRQDMSTYLVDFCVIRGELYLLSGVRDDDGNAGPLFMTHWATQRRVPLPRAHREICRVALGHGDRMITAGEDNVVAFWVLGATAAEGAGNGAATAQRHNVSRPRRSQPYAK